MSLNSWLDFSVAQCRDLSPYIPGKPIDDVLRQYGLDSAVKLASNENPYGPSPKAKAAIVQAIEDLHRYPDGDGHALKQALAEHHGIKTDQLLLGNGSNEVLELLIRCFAGAGDEVIYAERGFIVYALATKAAAAMPVPVPERDDYHHDLSAMLAAVNERSKVICIANPNNPTGTLLAQADVQAFLDALPRRMVVIVDEAYHAFVCHEQEDSCHVLSHPGLVLTRTFSKAYGLAGLRIGYAIADAALLAVVNRMREPFNVNSLAQAAAIAALDDQQWLQTVVDDCLQQRQLLEVFLQQYDCLAVRSHANFVLLQHKDALALHARLEQQGLITRPLAAYGMADVLRISVGSAEENALLMQALEDELA